MNRWSAFALLLAVAGALALRVPRLDSRPLHNDEAVNAVKVADLWLKGSYKYDPDEYHGPLLHYASLPFLTGSGPKSTESLDDGRLRLVTVAFGVGLILLLPLLRDGIGNQAMAWTAVFTAISPAMVFYSRYFIHEILLVFFTFLTLCAAWRYTRSRSVYWAALTGAGVGLMFATKETFVLNLAAMIPAALWPASFSRVDLRQKISVVTDANRKHLVIAAGCAVLIWLLFFTSFFANPGGLLDSARTYLPWLKRAGGHSPHLHPWYFYLQRLAWFHPAKGPLWSEGMILLLALAGIAMSVRRGAHPLHRFLAIYTILLTVIYSLISYKTPWCLLGFFHGMILLAGIGTARILAWFKGPVMRATVATFVALLAVQLVWQAWRADTTYASDRRNPYVYAQTLPDILSLVKRANVIAGVATGGFETVIKVIAPESDYWPLPWYLRRFKNVGWYEELPADPYSPIILVSSKLGASLDEKSERKWVMTGYAELRPGKFFESYVELELWKKFVASLPKDQD